MRTYSSLVRSQIQQQLGFEVRSVDHSFLIAFTGVQRALLCAVAIQRAISQYGWEHLNRAPQVRIGLSSEAIHDSGDLFGKAIILAAKIGAATPGGAILVSAAFKEVTEGTSDFHFDKGRDLYLQGLTGTYRVYGVEWNSPGPRLARQAGE
jgi:class 3 adenylate cyclase